MKFGSLVLIGALAASLGAPSAALAQQTPPPAMHAGHHMDRFATLGLTPQQRAQIKTLRRQYWKAHPKGSPRDPAGVRALRKQVLGVLTPAQRAQLRAERHGSPPAAAPGASPQP